MAKAWQDYGELVGAHEVGVDDVLIRDVSDITDNAAGTNKRWKPGALAQPKSTFLEDEGPDAGTFFVVGFDEADNPVFADVSNLPTATTSYMPTANVTVSAVTDSPAVGTSRHYTAASPVLVTLDDNLADGDDCDLAKGPGSGVIRIRPGTGKTLDGQGGSSATAAVSDAAWGTPSGNNVTVTSAGNNLPILENGALVEVRNHTTADNNGFYILTSTSTAGSMALAKRSGNAPQSAAAVAVEIDTIRSRVLHNKTYVKRRGTDYEVDGATDEATTAFADHDANGHVIKGNLVAVETKTGALLDADSGKRLTTTGPITVPTTPGWWAVVRLGANTHDISFNSATLDVSAEGWAAGDKLAVTVMSATEIEIERTANADVVDQGSFV